LGELAQFAGRPALMDATAEETVDALIIPPERLRALMIAEAELGERIMRALILRRVAILRSGADRPIILGRAENGDVVRLQDFLRRNGQPHLETTRRGHRGRARKIHQTRGSCRWWGGAGRGCHSHISRHRPLKLPVESPIAVQSH
jgi:hypothetical protein